MSLPEQTSPESRLLARLTREDVGPENRVLSRLHRHADPGVLAHSSDRYLRSAVARSSVGYSPQRQTGMLARIVRRAGLRPAPGNVGFSALGTDFVSAPPPGWHAPKRCRPASRLSDGGAHPSLRHR